MSLEIQKVLVLSTGHLPQEVMEDLGEGSALTQKYLIAPYEYGAFVWVPTDWSSTDFLPKELRDALDFAGIRYCQWVRFDSDGPRVDDLPYWEW
jgi:hypothetical protein